MTSKDEQTPGFAAGIEAAAKVADDARASVLSLMTAPENVTDVRVAVEMAATRIAQAIRSLTPPTDAAPVEAVERLQQLLSQFERIAAKAPNEQPCYADGVRPFGTGDLRYFMEGLRNAIAALSNPVETAKSDAMREALETILKVRVEGHDNIWAGVDRCRAIARAALSGDPS